jgi:hypothetical protein
MLKIVIESPFRPSDDDVRRYADRYTRSELLRQNLVYARLALLDALGRGEAPLASHLLYTQVWAETDELRAAGIKAGIEWAHRTDRVVLYTDLGVSRGMQLAADNAQLIRVTLERRTLFQNAERDPRDELASLDLGTFPYLEELRALEYQERTASGKVRLS